MTERTDRWKAGAWTVPALLLWAFLSLRPAPADAKQKQALSSWLQGMLKHAIEEVDPLERAALLRELQTYFYVDLDRLDRLEHGDREEAEDILEELIEQAADMLELKEEEPERYREMTELRRYYSVSAELAEAIRKTNDQGESEKLTARLRKSLEAYFDLKQKLMLREIREIGYELEELKRIYQKRKEKRNRMIERRLRELVEEEEDLEW